MNLNNDLRSFHVINDEGVLICLREPTITHKPKLGAKSKFQFHRKKLIKDELSFKIDFHR